MKNFHIILFVGVMLLFMFPYSVQSTSRKVLFLGNSYTYVNNLPLLISDFAASTGDSLIYDSNTPGGYTLDQHFSDPNSTNKIIAGAWDYVVMQEQSQLPALEEYISSGGANLSALIEQYNPCARKLFYMTWGRKNGDASFCGIWPPVCTYEGMDSLLYLRYVELAFLNNAELSPVGQVWKYIRQHYPSIELYQTDESHPSLAGSYAAAACFYTVLFRKDPSLSNYKNSLDSTEAAIIRQAAKIIVYDSLGNWDYANHLAVADFSYTIGTGINEVITSNRSLNADYYLWDWGDGTTSSLQQATHNYSSIGSYVITLTASKCDLGLLNSSTLQRNVNFCNHSPRVYPDSLLQCPDTQDSLWTQVYDSYQWLDAEGLALPGDTSQYFIPAGNNEYSVQTTLNNCTARSPSVFVSGFSAGIVIYRVDSFSTSSRTDTICQGDTVLMILQPNKPSGNDFYFQWYKSGIEIPFATDDSLYVTSSGDYQVKVHNLYCPSYLYYQNLPLALTFLNCNIGIDEADVNFLFQLYPNPVNDYLTLITSRVFDAEAIWKILDPAGRIVQEGKLKQAQENRIILPALAPGLYFIDCSDNSIKYTGKFIMN